MKKSLTLGLAAAAIIAALPLAAWADDGQASATDAGATPYYERGPRIIHVPSRADEVDEQAPARVQLDRQEPPRLRRHVDRDAAPSRHVKPATRRHAELPPPRKPYSVPPPSGPRRAVLNAPPPHLESATESAEKFAAPNEPATSKPAAIEPAAPSPVVSATSPPPGYTPPTATLPAASPPAE